MTPLFKKLNYKTQDPILIVNAPESFASELEQMTLLTQVCTDPATVVQTGFIMAFVTLQSEVDAYTALLTPKMDGDGVLWFCYPKGSSKKYTCAFNRDTGWKELGKAGFEPVRMVAIDEDWSALRFRKARYIKTMTRSFARSEEGKAKVQSGKKASQ